MELILPSYTVDWFLEGQHCEDAIDGDLILMDHGTWEDDLISLAQEVLVLTQHELKGCTWCAHTGIVHGYIDGRTALSEMGPGGHERRTLYDYKHHLYARVRFNVDEDARKTAMSYDTACSHLAYGWAQYPVLALDELTGEKWACSWGCTIVCSTHCTMVLMGLGLFPDLPPSMVIPARMAYWFKASKPVAIGSPTGIIVTPGIPLTNVGPPTTIIVTPGIPQAN